MPVVSSEPSAASTDARMPLRETYDDKENSGSASKKGKGGYGVKRGIEAKDDDNIIKIMEIHYVHKHPVSHFHDAGKPLNAIGKPASAPSAKSSLRTLIQSSFVDDFEADGFTGFDVDFLRRVVIFLHDHFDRATDVCGLTRFSEIKRMSATIFFIHVAAFHMLHLPRGRAVPASMQARRI